MLFQSFSDVCATTHREKRSARILFCKYKQNKNHLSHYGAMQVCLRMCRKVMRKREQDARKLYRHCHPLSLCMSQTNKQTHILNTVHIANAWNLFGLPCARISIKQFSILFSSNMFARKKTHSASCTQATQEKVENETHLKMQTKAYHSSDKINKLLVVCCQCDFLFG